MSKKKELVFKEDSIVLTKKNTYHEFADVITMAVEGALYRINKHAVRLKFQRKLTERNAAEEIAEYILNNLLDAYDVRFPMDKYDNE